MPEPSLNVAIIGDGGWGTALGIVLHDNGHRVRVWGPFADYVTEVRRTAENRTFLPGVPIPDGMHFTADRAEAVEAASLVILASPTKFFRTVAESFKGLIPPDASIVSVAKGLDDGTRDRMTVVAAQVLGRHPIAALSGPSLAPEVARRVPTAVVIASSDPDQGRRLQKVFSNSRFRVYTTDDVAGVELGGALKNVIAVAAGISDGLGFGDNTRAALITRGLAEITRLGLALGARPSTFAGLSGAGDLILTCNSRQSRNHAVGERLGRGEPIQKILGDMKQVAEGVWNCVSTRELAHQAGVDVPITEEVYAVVHQGKSPCDALSSLMSRDMKSEQR